MVKVTSFRLTVLLGVIIPVLLMYVGLRSIPSNAELEALFYPAIYSIVSISFLPLVLPIVFLLMWRVEHRAQQLELKIQKSALIKLVVIGCITPFIGFFWVFSASLVGSTLWRIRNTNITLLFHPDFELIEARYVPHILLSNDKSRTLEYGHIVLNYQVKNSVQIENVLQQVSIMNGVGLKYNAGRVSQKDELGDDSGFKNRMINFTNDWVSHQENYPIDAGYLLCNPIHKLEFIIAFDPYDADVEIQVTKLPLSESLREQIEDSKSELQTKIDQHQLPSVRCPK